MLLRHAGSVAGWTLVSRFLGLLRDLVMAATLGAGPLADAFMVAFRLPNHLRVILAEGAFNAAFLPTYAAVLEREGQGPAAAFRAEALSWILLVNLALLLAALAGTGWLILALAPGFDVDARRFDLAVGLTRITFPYLLCLSLVTLLTAVLNAHGRFAAGAAAPVLLNLAMIGALLAAELFPDAAHAAAAGVLAGGVAQLALLLLAARRAALALRLARPRLSPALRLFARRFGPAVLGAGGIQIAVFADTIIATLLPAGSLSYLYYADRLYQLPLAVIGIALGTAILPALARRVAARDEAGAAAELGRGLALAFVAGLPCALLLALLGDWILEVLFGRGAFGAPDVAGSAAALVAYSAGLLPAILLRPLNAAFHARGDTATPVKALLVASLVNLGLKLVLVEPLLHAGLAAATSAGAWVDALILLALLQRRRRLRLGRAEKALIAGGLLGGLAATVVALLGRQQAPAWLPLELFGSAAALPLAATAGAAVAAYGLLVGLAWLGLMRRGRPA